MGWVEHKAVEADQVAEERPCWRVLEAELESVASGLDQRFVCRHDQEPAGIDLLVATIREALT